MAQMSSKPPFLFAESFFWPRAFTKRLASDRGAENTALTDHMGGLYLGLFERFILYFKYLDDLEAVMTQCGVREPVWSYRISMHEVFRNTNNRSNPYLNSGMIY